MILDGFFADKKLLADVFVALARRQRLENFQLAGGEFGKTGGGNGRRGAGANSFQRAASHSPVKPRHSQMNLLTRHSSRFLSDSILAFPRLARKFIVGKKATRLCQSRKGHFLMFMRIDKLQVDLPANLDPDPAAAAAVQELMGGRFGEMSTLNNYMYQSFNMRGRNDIVPFYDLVASITAEEFGHVELVAATINLLQNGGVPDSATPTDSPLAGLNNGNGIRHQFLNNGHSTLAANAQAAPWQGDYVFNSGNLVLDMLHNFFLESGARMGKLRVYESVTHPVAKRLCGYLLVRGGVHQLAYAMALNKITGVEVEKMLPIPDIRTDKIPECAEFIARDLHVTLYRFSPDDYKHIGDVFNGTHPEDGKPLQVREGIPDGHALADLPPVPASGVPSFDMGEIKEIAARLMKNM